MSHFKFGIISKTKDSSNSKIMSVAHCASIAMKTFLFQSIDYTNLPVAMATVVDENKLL
jgi:hypothetical protein